jgi:DNA-directed RNA polymerase subunit RPC12/RpoP
MGPYCDYCGHRCFVERRVPGSDVTILATCERGAAHERAALGYDHTTAINPRAANEHRGRQA